MPTVTEYMQFANTVYATSDNNNIGIPAGWRELDWTPDTWTGFSAGAYRNGNDVVISFTGTNNFWNDSTSWLGGLGASVPQIFDAVAYYFKIKSANPDANITFTGHSLGGGLASLMAVFFDKQATVFDQAPFELAAINRNVIADVALQMFVMSWHDQAFDDYKASGGSAVSERELKVSQYWIEGEVLSPTRLPWATLAGNDNMVDLGATVLSDIDRHSMALLTAVHDVPEFLKMVQKIPYLVQEMYDKTLFAAADSDTAKTDVLRTLLRHQLGVPGQIAPDGMLDRFTSDLNKVAQDGGLTMSSVYLTKALIAFAMQMYNTTETESGDVLFRDVTGGIRFDRSDIAASLDAITGYERYFTKFMDSRLTEGRDLITGQLPELTDWFIQAGTADMNATADAERAFMLGYTGDDSLTGGILDDVLIGGWGDDSLAGMGGDDILMGGYGQDRYTYASGHGFDTILDDVGAIIFDGSELDGGKRKNDETMYWSGDKLHSYDWDGGDLLIDGTIRVVNFNNMDLGIYLDYHYEHENPDSEDVPDYDSNLSKRRIDPLAFDLDHSGKIDTIASTASSAYFDFNGDGIAERSGWVAAEDGLLVLDANDNGAIDNLSELFGTAEVDGFTDLKQRIDSNGDNRIDAGDEQFARLRVWQDANGDGIAHSTEIQTLEQHGITSIGLDAVATSIADADNMIVATGTFVQDGENRLVGDVELAVNFSLTDSNPLRALDQNLKLDADVYQLPWLRGYGLVKTLHEAYQGDLALRQAGAALAGQSAAGIMANFDAFIAKWSGLEAAHQAKGVTRTEITLEDKVWMLETLMGQDTNKSAIEAAGFGNPFEGNERFDPSYVNTKYMGFVSRSALGFAMQSAGKHLIDGVYYSVAKDKFVALDPARVQAGLQSALNAIANEDDAAFAAMVLVRLKADGIDLDAASMKQGLSESPFAHIFATALDFVGEHVTSLASGTNFTTSDDSGWFVVGSSSGDRINGAGGNDVLSGGSGNDLLIGGAGRDTLQGGVGYDHLWGGSGNDVYLYRRGDGSDTISEENSLGRNTDTIRFATGIEAADVKVSRDKSNLYLRLAGTTDRLTLQSWFVGDAYKVEWIEFADGTVWGVQEMAAAAAMPTALADHLSGTSGDDFIAGLHGNDTLYGEAGADTLDGGAGDDSLQGGVGDDVYLFKRGDGADTIYDVGTAANMDTLRFGEGIAAGDVIVRRDQYHLYLSLAGSEDRLTLQWWYNTDKYRIEQVEFADGTVWGVQELAAAAAVASEDVDYLSGTSGNDAIAGLGGNDTLLGEAGDDTLDGGAGEDYLQGGFGHDVYLFKRGDGADKVYDYGSWTGDTDTIRFAEGIAAGDVIVSRDQSHLYLSLAGSADRLTLQYWFSDERYQVERIEFADGTVWGLQQLAAAVAVATEDADYLSGTSGNDAITGLGGNDTLLGQAGHDTLDGGAGEDDLQGGTGNDVYLFKRGDGADKVYDYDYGAGNTDTIRFAAGIAVGDVIVSRDDKHLYLSLAGGSDRLTVQSWFYSNEHKVERVEFADGTVWGVQELVAAAAMPTEGADRQYGSDGNDALAGLGGNDTLLGKAGDDTLDGGAGQDELQGGAGNDAYLFKRGDGADSVYEYDTTAGNTDTIRFAADIAPGDVTLSRDEGNLYLSLAGGTDRLTLLDWFYGDQYQVERVEFADGTVWGVQELLAATAMATEGDDYLVGTSGNDVIAGLGGNDTLVGEARNDVYLFKRGDGADTIYDSDFAEGNTDTIRFAQGIAAGDVIVSRDQWNLYLSLADSSDRLTVLDWFYTETYKVERVEFADGTVWGVPELAAAAAIATEGDDYLDGTGGSDALAGLGGNDALSGAAGNDTLEGGAGDDKLKGGAGVDILDGGAGDDRIDDSEGNNALAGGDGNDQLFANGYEGSTKAAYFLAGGRGNDQIQAQSARYVVGFNAGDGTDVVFASYMDTLTLSLGGGISAASLELSIDGGDFVLGTGAGDSIRLILLADRTPITLQIIGSAVETYDFNAVLTAFEAALAQGATASAWPLAAALASNLLSTSADQVIGGNLAYRYAQDGNLAALTPEAIRAALASEQFGAAAQSLGGGGVGVVVPSAGISVAGTAADDTLQGTDRDDTLSGHAGNDILGAGLGNDTYVFNAGDGVDRIADTGGADTIAFGAGIAAASLSLSLGADGSLLLRAGADGDAIHLDGFAPANALANPVIENFRFADGSSLSHEQLLARGFDLSGSAVINGTNLRDRIIGGNDADTLTGGKGDDALAGSGGIDTYRFELGDGVDTLYDMATATATATAAPAPAPATAKRAAVLNALRRRRNVPGAGPLAEGSDLPFERSKGAAIPRSSHDSATVEEGNRIVFGAGIVQADLRFERNNGAAILRYSASDAIVLRDFDLSGARGSAVVSIIEFADGSTVGMAELAAREAVALGDNGGTVGAGAVLTLDANSLLANDTTTSGSKVIDGVAGRSAAGAEVTYLNGSISYDSGALFQSLGQGATRTDTFSYTMAETAGAIAIGGASVTVTVTGSNDAPVLAEALDDASLFQGRLFRFTIPSTAFTDVDAGDTLTYAVTAADGSELPGWLRFDSATGTLSGRPANGDVGALAIKVTATDSLGAAASGSFSITVIDVNDAPLLTNPIAAQTVVEDDLFSYTLAANTFTDADSGDTLSYTAQLTDGNPLPAWLTFNAATRTFSGLPDADDIASLALRVTASDPRGYEASSTFDVTVLISPDKTLIGTSGNDILAGSSGNDILDGGAGRDGLTGKRGNDTYIIDNKFDWVTEHAGEGTDQVLSSVSFALGASVEHLTLTGTLAISGTGNLLNNALTGNSGNNVLDGGGGADTLLGGAGNDTYVVDNAGDAVAEATNAGIDLVQSSIDYALGSELENLTLTGTLALNGAGNAQDNILTGNAAANTLDGGAGNDTLNGGAGADRLTGGLGDDTYVVDNAGDMVIEDGGEDTDLVQSSMTYTLGAQVENLTLTGTLAISGTGNAFDNVLLGNSGVNTLNGGAGNDILNGAAGADTLIGGQGDDTYVVDNAADAVLEYAGEGTDLVQASVTYTLGAELEQLTLTGTGAINGTGNAQDNILTGNSGNNVLNGGAGADTLLGGAGNDTYIVDNAGDVVAEGIAAGTDLVQSSVDYVLGDDVENLTLTGTGAVNGVGNAFANIIIGNSADNLLDGGTGADALTGGAGNDSYVVDHVGDAVVENAGEGTDLVQASISYVLGSNVENLTLAGSAAVNGTGNTLSNIILGNGADNILNGGTGADTLAGAAGNDIYVVDNAGDVVTENDGEGTDLVQSSITYTLGAQVENLTLTGTLAISGTGNAFDNVLTGNAAVNTLNGDAGNDTLNGAAGADQLRGGTGDDIYVVDNAGDAVLENAGEGVDLVQAGVTYTLAANVEHLTLTGTGAINATGNTQSNVLLGNSGINTLNGGTGADTLAGGAGNDTYIIDGIDDVVLENAAEGIDLVQSSVSLTLAANVENLTLTGTMAINGEGNELDNLLLGNAGANVLGGGAGNDNLNGAAGADTLSGGAGNDTYVVDNAGDIVLEYAGEGTDLVQSSLTYTLGAELENLTLTGSGAINGTGNALANILVGNSGNNVLNGGAGADTLLGGVGNDTYVVDDAGDVVTEGLNAGTDLVQSSVDYVLSANVENLTLTGSSVINGSGNDLANILTGNSAANTLAGGAGNDTYVIDSIDDAVLESAAEGVDLVQSSVSFVLGANVENLTLTGTMAINGGGNELDNALLGNAGANVLSGGAGNDSLNGAAGADTLSGGAGDDTYVVDNAGDAVLENAGEGTDLVQSSLTYTLGAEVENLTLTGSGAINGTGNAYANILYGNGGANILNGGAGADTLLGGVGNDTYVVDDAGDVVTEGLNAGTDLVQSSFDYTLGANVENLTLTGSSAINGSGNALVNILTGNSAANTLAGGAGNDSYVVDSGDVVLENAAEGTDLVQSGASFVLGANVENLTLTGALAIDGGGNELANVLLGNAGANVLSGGAGNDNLNGAAGADTLIGGAGDDTYVVDNAGDAVLENAGEGTDLVQSSLTYTLGAELENLTLTGSGAINGTGNEFANILYGNGGANILNGGAGADTLLGGTGNDIYVVDDAGDVVSEGLNAGTDLVQSSLDYTLGANVENLTLTGSSAINGSGNALVNILTGNSAANTLAGGAGNDSYVVDSGDVVLENAAEGTDLVQSGASFVLGANVENLTLTGALAIDGGGNELDNVLLGNAGANVLSGGAGNDSLNGAAGADTLIGGAGDDTYVVDNAGDTVLEYAGEGMDLVQSSVTYTLGAEIENLTLTGSSAISGTGNDSANTLLGNAAVNTLAGGAGNDTLNGAAGADQMAGGMGDDVYVVDNASDAVLENAGEGADLVQSGVTHTLGANVENLTLTGIGAINGTGNAGNNLIKGNGGNNSLGGGAGNDIMQGAAGVDILTDTDGNNLLDGGAGSDTLLAGAGNDFLIGGAGNDTITTGTGADIIAFDRGDGQDIVNASTGNDNTLTLGRGITYADLLLNKSGNDLVLVTGAGEQVTFRDWYASADNHSVANLQMVIEGTADYVPASGNQLNSNKIAQFDFDALVDRFDEARMVNPLLSNWALSSSLLDFHLGSSDTAAIGGDLAYQYAKFGNLSNLSAAQAQALLEDGLFGQTAQTLQGPAPAQDGSLRLL